MRSFEEQIEAFKVRPDIYKLFILARSFPCHHDYLVKRFASVVVVENPNRKILSILAKCFPNHHDYLVKNVAPAVVIASPTVGLLIALTRIFPEDGDSLVRNFAPTIMIASPSIETVSALSRAFPPHRAYIEKTCKPLVSNVTPAAFALAPNVITLCVLALRFPRQHEYLVRKFAQTAYNNTPGYPALSMLSRTFSEYDYLFKAIDPSQKNAINKRIKRIICENKKAKVLLLLVLCKLQNQARRPFPYSSISANKPLVRNIARFTNGLPRHIRESAAKVGAVASYSCTR